MLRFEFMIALAVIACLFVCAIGLIVANYLENKKQTKNKP
jgi:hypothetical protein